MGHASSPVDPSGGVHDRGIAAERIFTHRWRLEEAEEAYRLFDTQTTGKGVIAPAA